MDAANALKEPAGDVVACDGAAVLRVAEYGREMYARGHENALESVHAVLEVAKRVADASYGGQIERLLIESAALVRVLNTPKKDQ